MCYFKRESDWRLLHGTAVFFEVPRTVKVMQGDYQRGFNPR